MHDHFLKLICDNPADIGPRLVYADWLEEHSDPRGEFIRVQCALSATKYDDPHHDTLIRRERELMRKHEKDWLRPLEQLLGQNQPRQPLASVTSWLAALLPREMARSVRGVATRTFPVWNVGFVNGFVESLYVNEDRLVGSGTLPQLVPLRCLYVNPSESADVKPLGWMTSDLVKHIIELEIRVSSVETNIWQQSWQRVQWPALQTILLESIPAHGLLALADAEVGSRLKSIAVSASPFDSFDIETLPRFSQLENLTLDNVSIDANSVAIISNQTLAQHLKRLLIHNCAIGNSTVLHIVPDRFPMLHYLGLESCEIGDSAAEYLAANRLLSQLSELSLVNNQVTDQGAMAFADSTHWRGTTKIDLRENPISPDVRRALKIRFGDRILIDAP